MRWAPPRGPWRAVDVTVMAVGVPLVLLGGFRVVRGDAPPRWWLPTVVGLVLLSVVIRGLAEWRRRQAPEEGA